MTDLREAIALELRIGLEILNAHAALSDDQLGWLADAVLAILPDAEALAVIAGNIASYLALNDCDGRSNDDALEIPLGDLRRLRVALANYRKGTGCEG